MSQTSKPHLLRQQFDGAKREDASVVNQHMQTALGARDLQARHFSLSAVLRVHACCTILYTQIYEHIYIFTGCTPGMTISTSSDFLTSMTSARMSGASLTRDARLSALTSVATTCTDAHRCVTMRQAGRTTTGCFARYHPSDRLIQFWCFIKASDRLY